MNVSEYMKKHGLNAMTAPYENGDYQSRKGEVFTGPHLDAVDMRRVTVIYDARDAQRVEAIAHSRGIKASEVYRETLSYYLTAQT